MVKEALDGVLHKTFHNTQSGVRSVIYNIVEQVLLDLLHEDDTKETLDAHITNLFSTCEARAGLSKKLLTSTTFMAPIAF